MNDDNKLESMDAQERIRHARRILSRYLHHNLHRREVETLLWVVDVAERAVNPTAVQRQRLEANAANVYAGNLPLTERCEQPQTVINDEMR